MKYYFLKKILIILLLLFWIILHISLDDFIPYRIFMKIVVKLKYYLHYYDNLFNSIEYDNYNLSCIYNNSYNTIKIKHIMKKKNSLNDIVCIFGILVNDKGIEIANEMLEWLNEEYDVYCIYQKYPGNFFEYPALRFAQWLSLIFNIKIILYIHTKGAFYPSKNQDKVRELWKYEFTNPRKNVYINLLKNNLADITLPFRCGVSTWFNGMFISNRAFNLINIIENFKYNRWYYESLFKQSSIRLKGILNDSIEAKYIIFEINKYLHNNRKEDNISK